MKYINIWCSMGWCRSRRLLFVLSWWPLSSPPRRGLQRWTCLRTKKCRKCTVRNLWLLLGTPTCISAKFFVRWIPHLPRCNWSLVHRGSFRRILTWLILFCKSYRSKVNVGSFRLIHCECRRVLAFLISAHKLLIFPMESWFSKIWLDCLPKPLLP